MQMQPYRWRLSPSFVAHAWKAATQQHHRSLIPLIARCVPRDGVVFDVGAHAGQFTKLFARFARDGQVYAIEPARYARAVLRVALAGRRLRNVTVVPVALGAVAGPAVLHTPIKASGARGFGLAHLGAPDPRWRRVGVEEVAQTTLDALAERLLLGRLDLIKADIEGSEMRMLAGARHTIKRFRPRLLIELNAAHLARAGDTVGDTVAFLDRLGYRAFVLEADGKLAPAAPGDGDFWFLPAGDPLAAGL